MEETDTDKMLKSVLETLIRKEVPKFKSLIQKELATRIQSKVEELKKALSGDLLGASKKDDEPIKPENLPENLPGAPSAPPTTSPKNAGDIKIIPTAMGVSRDDVSLDPNFEKEFYHSSFKHKGQDVQIKQLGTGFGKPVRVYVNGRRWEFFPGPKAAATAVKKYIEDSIENIKKDPELASKMTSQIKKDKETAVAQGASPVAPPPQPQGQQPQQDAQQGSPQPAGKKPPQKKPV